MFTDTAEARIRLELKHGQPLKRGELREVVWHDRTARPISYFIAGPGASCWTEFKAPVRNLVAIGGR
jgi:hypothetical protein